MFLTVINNQSTNRMTVITSPVTGQPDCVHPRSTTGHLQPNGHPKEHKQHRMSHQCDFLLKYNILCGNWPHQQLLLWRQTWCRCPVSPDQHPVGTNTAETTACGTQNNDLNSVVQLVKHTTSRNNMSQNKRWLKVPWRSTVGLKMERNTAGTKVNIYQAQIHPKWGGKISIM